MGRVAICSAYEGGKEHEITIFNTSIDQSMNMLLFFSSVFAKLPRK
jgi:hypothetical protein